MEHLEYIDNFFTEAANAEARKAFEQRILQDPAFAEEVAFYVSTRGIALEQSKEETKKRFREIYRSTPTVRQPGQVRKLFSFAAAAAVTAAALIIWFISGQSSNPQKLANQYVETQFQTLGVRMDAGQDSMQSAVRSFNENKLQIALRQFESIIASDPHNSTAVKYAGIVCLRLGDFDKALNYFKHLANEPGLYSNPGKFYQAVTFMKRNEQGDTAAAKKLLQDVSEGNLEGKELADEWLKKLE